MINKICFTASSGGHMEEISNLKELAKNREVFLITEKTHNTETGFCNKVYYTQQINRKEVLFLFKFFLIFLRSLYIFLKEKPECIISTGALATFPICLIGRIFKKKIIYIESFARIDSPSLTGRWMYKISDLFFVQWKEMLKYYPKAIYIGWIF